VIRTVIAITCLGLIVSLTGCDEQPRNNPYPRQDELANIYYSAFSESPKTLDPARSYSADEVVFTGQIYEPPLQYHFLKRPYTLEPLTATALPTVTLLDKQGNVLDDNAADDKVAYSRYRIHIKPGIRYQPHPAFAKDAEGQYRYHDLSQQALHHFSQLEDFTETGSRELVADDYIYEIKRLAHPRAQSPILGLMEQYIDGMDEYAETLQIAFDEVIKQQGNHGYLDLRKYPLKGVTKIDDYTYDVVLKGKYPQFKYWLAMPFFAPMPWEADAFYSQAGMAKKNIGFNWSPIGTGPYMLTENNPNRQMVLSRNPNYHGDVYPSEGEAGDGAAGLLADAGQELPFIDKFVFSLERESIPRWNKFLQGYYDASGIASDNFDEAVTISAAGEAGLTKSLQKKGVHLRTEASPSIFYIGFNMLDPVIGGYSDKQRKLRQAIAIAVNMEEFVSIFLNGRGIPANGPIPPGIEGHVDGEAGINSYVYEWKGGHSQRHSLDKAKQLLREAGYPGGVNANTGEPLVLSFDTVTGGSDDAARFDWLRKQFEKLGIQLHVRATQYNRFQEKMRTGNAQLFFWGWNADYPDPENFLFLLYGPHGKVNYQGENASNYASPEFDKLFEQMKNMPEGQARDQVIARMVEIVRRDSPWIWGFFPKSFALTQAWVTPRKLNAMANNSMKYIKLDPRIRDERHKAWNKPLYWPLLLIVLGLLVVLIPVIWAYHVKVRKAAKRV